MCLDEFLRIHDQSGLIQDYLYEDCDLEIIRQIHES